MTKFSDQLFDDLMQEHGHTLASTTVKAPPRRHPAVRPALLTAGVGGMAAAITVGTLVAGGGSPAYAVTTHPDGTVSLAVYQQSGYDQVNAKLRQLGEGRVVVVPVGKGCPGITSLRAPKGQRAKGQPLTLALSATTSGGATVNASGIPKGDILVVALPAHIKANGPASTTGTNPASTKNKDMNIAVSRLTSGPVPSCVSVPPGQLAPPGTKRPGPAPAGPFTPGGSQAKGTGGGTGTSPGPGTQRPNG